MRQGVSRRVRLLGIGAVAVLVAAGCGSSTTSQEPTNAETGGEKATTAADPAPADAPACQTDADCVPDACCHPAGCVQKDAAPEGCGEAMCTAECKEGTLDCGKGTCACMDGACGVNWAE